MSLLCAKIFTIWRPHLIYCSVIKWLWKNTGEVVSCTTRCRLPSMLCGCSHSAEPAGRDSYPKLCRPLFLHHLIPSERHISLHSSLLECSQRAELLPWLPIPRQISSSKGLGCEMAVGEKGTLRLSGRFQGYMINIQLTSSKSPFNHNNTSMYRFFLFTCICLFSLCLTYLARMWQPHRPSM